jgi:hypothetical protein
MLSGTLKKPFPFLLEKQRKNGVFRGLCGFLPHWHQGRSCESCELPAPRKLGSCAWKGLRGLERDWYGRQWQCDRRCQVGRDVSDAPVVAFEIQIFSIDQVNRDRKKLNMTPLR